ncbi:ERCC4 domain-containing protein [Promethearchaeum syntrophicum]|uniref:ERCC4 domain-containing protein n=1 Tax=Promethearchaeum syntrophicum TaxID=2594042 RepID=A0A5B9D919_9ARCH|nr:ERCC4 domain-containing protein [Candidatus Prometheoarchaeum syntrophicum]QEE15649.1 ATP-dependent RNA helicase SrmB [Candidatus Prometheoarchaeum syntrophicum]
MLDQFINHEFLKPNLLLKRKYQVDIFVTCSKKNCLVVVPTGLGKTIIALLLSLHYLKKKKKSKIIFLAPTRPLVEQHLQTFKNLTNFDSESLIMMTGTIAPKKRVELYKEDDTKCFFMTPQVLQNDIIGNRVSLLDVALIIFDEAHRASGNYAYNFLAKKYVEHARKPRILAMTASPGKNREIIEEVMQNLFLETIEIRTDSDPDVKPYIQDVKVIWKDIELPEEMHQLNRLIVEMKKKIYKELKSNELLDSENVQKITRRNLLSAMSALDALIVKGKYGSDLPRLLYCKKLFSNAIRLSHMSELLEAHGIKSLKTYLDKNLKDVQEGKGGKSLEELFNNSRMDEIIENVKMLTFDKVDHPKMIILMDILQEQFQINPESRILVFCHFRDTISHIIKEISNNELIKPSKFIGQQTKGKEKGFSQKKQLEILEQFKNGDFNTLVATSVGEEGLDISECDVVIFFDVVPSEIRAIQRRGRTGRNKSGKVYVFKTKGTREEGYFWAEKRREKEMKRVLKEIKKDLGDSPLQRKSKKKKDLISFIQTSGKKQISSQKEVLAKEKNSEKSEKNEIDNETKFEKKKINFSANTVPIDSSEPKILVDSRETASSVTRELSERNALISLEKLPIGDYIISERCGIERKSVQDFTDSIKDGRLFKELQKLRTQFSLPILILEGNLNSILSIKRAAILGTLSSILLNMNILLLQTLSPEETAEMLYALAKKEQQTKDKKNFSIRFKKLPEKISEQMEYIVSGIPGINSSRAKDLLNQFHSLRELFSAEIEDLEKTPNIGPVLAQTILKYSITDYEKSTKTENQ